MDDLDFTSRPARSAIYDPAVAQACFQALGREERVGQGGTFFVEHQASDRMYLLAEGEVSLIHGSRALDVVKAGEIFGEMAVISGSPRSATAAARSACRAFSLDARQFQDAIRKTPEFALMLMGIIINRLRLTAELVGRKLPEGERLSESRMFDEHLLLQLVDHLSHRPPVHVPCNKVLMKEGEGGVFMYVVLKGRIAISIKSRLVEVIGPGGVFGEMALLDRSPRAASATAETDCDVLSINRDDFIKLVNASPAFTVSLLKALVGRLRFLTAHHK